MKWRWTKALVACATALAVVAGGLGLAFAVASWRMGPPPLANAEQLSTVVLDRQGRLLRAFTTAGGRWRLPVEVADVDPRYLAILMAFEDRRFHSHVGVDVAAVMRAGLQFARHGRIVSGASTLTMQVARLVEGEHGKTGIGKLKQMVRALQIEQRLTKAEILRVYLRMAPFGGNLEGVRAASLAYFGKEAKRLSIAEAALLVALPQSPEARRPDRTPEAARRARDRVLDRAVSRGVITVAEARQAKSEPMPRARAEFPKLAPHLAEAEVARKPDAPVHRLTLDRDLQAGLETLARTHARSMGPQLSAGVIVADHTTGEVLAWVGSSDYFDDSRQGAVDMGSAVRSPGSTLKPFIYGLAFEDGLAHPEMLIEDRPARFNGYAPKNFDEEFHGTVTIREALAQSLNIPAVKVLNAVGPGRLVGRMRRAGVPVVIPGQGEPTLAVALGGLGLRLQDLAQMYAGLARGGKPVRLILNRDDKASAAGPSRALLGPVASWYVTDILKDAPPPAANIGGRIAYKTGTSYGYRDAWAIGYDGQHTIAVWIGRADGTATPGLTGRTAAAPLLFEAFQRLGQSRAALPSPPNGAIRASGANLPPPLKRFQEAGEERQTGPYIDSALQIAFPPDRSDVELEDDDTPLVLKAEGGALPLTWMVDDAPIATSEHSRELTWQPGGRGFVKLSVIDARGRVDRVTVRVR